MMTRIILLTLLLFTLASTRIEADEGLSREKETRHLAIQQTKEKLLTILSDAGGSSRIREALSPFRKEVQDAMAAKSSQEAQIFKVGKYDFNKYITASALKGKWLHESNEKDGLFDPVDVIIDFDRMLKDLNIDLIVVPVPSKIEAYPGVFDSSPGGSIPICPARVAKMLDLLNADVEVIDVLPTLHSLITEEDDIPVYEKVGHHISGIGVKHCGDLVAERLSRHELKGSDTSRFSDKKRRSTERIDRGVRMFAWPVRMDGKKYKHVDDSEVVIIGDSNAFAYESSSWASHIARATGIPITDLSFSNGGATAHTRLVAQGLDSLKKRKVVVWIVASAHFDLEPWKKAPFPAGATVIGLAASGKVDEAVKKYHELVKAGTPPELDEEEVTRIAFGFIQNRDYATAHTLLEINAEAFPRSPDALTHLANVSYRVGKKDQARSCFEKALTLDPAPHVKERILDILKKLDEEDQK